MPCIQMSPIIPINMGGDSLRPQGDLQLNSRNTLAEKNPSENVTVSETIAAAKGLKKRFDDLFKNLIKVIRQTIDRDQTRCSLDNLKLQIRLRLNHARDTTRPAVTVLLERLEKCETGEKVAKFLLDTFLLGYLNFDLFHVFKVDLLSGDFNKMDDDFNEMDLLSNFNLKLEEYVLAHNKFIKNNFRNIIEAFAQEPLLKPASDIGLPEFKVHLSIPWKSKSIYYWKELLENYDWRSRLFISGIDFNCVTISYQVLPYLLHRVIADLTDEKVVKRFAALGVTFTISDKLKEKAIADDKWIKSFVEEQRQLLKKSDIVDHTEVDYDSISFISPPPKDLKCPVCRSILREPCQLSCCGATLCQACNASMRCPCCEDTHHEIKVDKQTRRRVMRLQVKCSVTNCHWIGELLNLNRHKCPQSTCFIVERKVPVLHHDGCKQCPPVEITMTEFEKRKASQEHWYSPSFYSHPEGYKLCIKLNPSGQDEGDGTHLSLFAHIMHGDYDDSLAWPFMGEIKLQLRNQRPAATEHSHKEAIIQYDESVPLQASDRITHGGIATRSGFASIRGVGCAKLISYHDLLYDPTRGSDTAEYLKDDSILVRVTEVMHYQTSAVPRPATDEATHIAEVVVPNFEMLKANKNAWESPPFYTRPDNTGYKFLLAVHANGKDKNEEYVSVYTHLMRGEHDNELEFPFRGIFTVQLINQREDKNHAESLIRYTAEEDPEGWYGQRISWLSPSHLIAGRSLYGGLGNASFMPHDALLYNRITNTQYRSDVNDELVFRIYLKDI